MNSTKTGTRLKQNHLPQNKKREAIARLPESVLPIETELAGSLRFLLWLLLVTLFAQHSLAAQPDLVSFDRQHLYKNLIPFLQLVADGTNPSSAISLMCSKPSVPEKISTNAPNSAIRTTLPR